MNLFSRAFLYLKGKKSRTIIMILIISFVTSSIMTAFTINKLSHKIQDKTKKQLKTVLLMPRKDVLPTDSHGEGDLEKKYIRKLKNSKEVKGINASQLGLTMINDYKVVKPKNENSSQFELEDEEVYASVFGNTNTKYDSRFISGMMKLEEGNHINDSDNNKILIHKEFAKLNNLKIGDKISFTKDPFHYKGKDFSKVEAEVKGIFSGNTFGNPVYPEEMLENTFFSDENTVNEIYGYKEKDIKYYQCDFYLKDNVNVEKFVNKIKNSGIDMNYFEIAKKDPSLDTYNRSLQILENTVKVVFFGTLLISIAILILTMIYWINTKRKDTGIFMSIGKSKFNIVMQYLVEILIITSIAFTISFGISENLGNYAGNNLINKASKEARQEVVKDMGGFQFGSDSLTDMNLQTVKNTKINITSNEYIKFYMFILIIVIIASLISIISIIRLKPRDIFTKLN